jgi:hypothetical protein
MAYVNVRFSPENVFWWRTSDGRKEHLCAATHKSTLRPSGGLPPDVKHPSIAPLSLPSVLPGNTPLSKRFHACNLSNIFYSFNVCLVIQLLRKPIRTEKLNYRVQRVTDGGFAGIPLTIRPASLQHRYNPTGSGGKFTHPHVIDHALA